MRKQTDGLGLGKDEYRDRPRKVGKRDVQARFNHAAVLLNALHDELSGLRHDLDVAERYDEPRQSFPVHYVEPEP
jgi:hypothetical protein